MIMAIPQSKIRAKGWCKETGEYDQDSHKQNYGTKFRFEKSNVKDKNINCLSTTNNIYWWTLIHNINFPSYLS